MLTIEGEDEPSPFHSISFLLPMMYQITMDIEGCEALISFRGYKADMSDMVREETNLLEIVTSGFSQ
ncbi:hypothetical protein SADUNF_Sadunf16G0034400 [Salix dunnii]|uniref:Uncharacterized protein n=1 Tax=Salix dunnii TaxID=1413687 RepID=A0A835J7T6_9ROSI|nr:hypothetical protein SADUNF_Sadunf16G0034400 [Salix dunnii]